MAIAVEMPKLGNTVEECLLAKWRKQKGEAVAPGDVIAEIETDKATFDVTAPSGGMMLATFFGEGALVPVYTNICVIGEPGEDAEPFRTAAKASTAAAETVVRPASPAAAAPVSAPAQVQTGQAAPPPPAPPRNEVFLSPRARRFAERHHFAPAQVAGSGPGGRVLESDIRQAYYASPHLTPLAAKYVEEGYEAKPKGTGPAATVLARDLGEPPVPLSNIRARTARRMRESLATTAQYTLHSSADATGLLALRRKVKAAREQGAGLADVNIGDMVMFAAVKALAQVPSLNVEFVDGKLYQRKSIHIGFACDTPKGLLVPVVHGCEELEIGALAARAKGLAEQAVGGTLALDDMSGATFTLSNLGSFGIESFTPILNPPQVAILGVNAIQLKPVRRGGKVEFGDFIGLSLTLDHQIIDGAPGARFLQVLSGCIADIEGISGL